MKKFLSLFLALLMLLSVLPVAAVAEEVAEVAEMIPDVLDANNLEDITATFTIKPKEGYEVVRLENGAAYVDFGVYLRLDDTSQPMEACSFTLVPGDGVTFEDYTCNTAQLSKVNITQYKDSYGHPYNQVGYEPSTGYFGMAGYDGVNTPNYSEDVLLMTVTAKVTAAGDYSLDIAKDGKLIAGQGDLDNIDKMTQMFNCAVETEAARVVSVDVSADAAENAVQGKEFTVTLNGLTSGQVGGLRYDAARAEYVSATSTPSATPAGSVEFSAGFPVTVTFRAKAYGKMQITPYQKFTFSGAEKSFDGESVGITARPATPAAELDLANQKITGLVPGGKYEITVNGKKSTFTADNSGCISYAANYDTWKAKNLSIVQVVENMKSEPPQTLFIPVSGTCGEEISWKLEDGVLTISGEGPMDDYTDPSARNAKKAPYYEYRNSITGIVIEGGITRVGNWAFCDTCNVSGELTVPKTVTTIGNNAFRKCGMSGMTVLGDISSVGFCAFAECDSLKLVTFKGYLGLLAGNAFDGCKGTWTETSSGTRSGSCGEDLEWNFDDTTGKLTISGTGSMDDFDLDANCYYGRGGTTAPWYPLCNLINSVEIAEDVTYLGNLAFSDCTGLTELTLPESVVRVGGGTFAGCSSLGSVTIKGAIEGVSGDFFYDCTSLTSVTFEKPWACATEWDEDTPIIVGGYMFAECSALESIDLPDGLTYLQNGAFSNCDNLTSVSLPATMVLIEGGRNSVFENCPKLSSVTFRGTQEQWDGVLRTDDAFPAGLTVLDKDGEPLSNDDPYIQQLQALVDSATTVIPTDYAGFDADTLDTLYISADGKNVYSDFRWITAANLPKLQAAINAAIGKQVGFRLKFADAQALEKTVNGYCKPGTRVDCTSFELQVSKVAQVMNEGAPYELAAGKSATFAIVTDPLKTTEAFTLSDTDETFVLSAADGAFTAKLSGTNITVTANKNAAADQTGHFTVTSTSGKTREIFAKVIVPTTKITLGNSQNNSKAPSLTYNGAVESRSITLTADAAPADHTDTINWTITKGGEFAELLNSTGAECVLTAKEELPEGTKLPASVTVQAAASGKTATVTVKIGAAADCINVTTGKDVVAVPGVENSYKATMLAGKTLALKATAAIWDEATDKPSTKNKPIDTNVTWAIEEIIEVDGNTYVGEGDFAQYATVDAKGTVKALRACFITVTATAVAAAEECPVATFTVSATPVVKSFGLKDSAGKAVSTLSAVVGVNIDLSEYVSIVWTDGTEQGGDYDNFETVAYAVDTKSAAFGTVDEFGGVFTPTAAGSAKVTVSAVGKTATVTIKVGQGADKVTTTAKTTAVSLVYNGKPVSTTLKATAVIWDSVNTKASSTKPISPNVTWDITGIKDVHGDDVNDENYDNYAAVDLAKGTVTAKQVCTVFVKATPETPVPGYSGEGDLSFTVNVTPALKSFSLKDANGKAPALSAVVDGEDIDLSDYVSIVWTDGTEQGYGYANFETVTYAVDAKTPFGTVDAGGVFTPTLAGTAKVTATMEATGKTATVTIKVSQHADTVTTTAKTTDVNLLIGKNTTLKATAAIAGSKEKPLGGTAVVWTSLDEDVATVDEKGKVVAVGEGTCVVTARPAAENTSGSLTFTVYVTPALKSFTMERGGSKLSTLSAVTGSGPIYLSGYEKVVWGDNQDHPAFEDVKYTIDKTTYGTVTEDGVFTPNAVPGTAKITARLVSMNKTVTITVKTGLGADKVTTTAKTTDVSLLAGKTTTLKATAVIWDEANNRAAKDKPISANVEWKVDKVTVDGTVVEQDYSDYVTVDAKGKVTARLACTATITATPEAPVPDYATANNVTFTVKVDPVLSKVELHDPATGVKVSKVNGYKHPDRTIDLAGMLHIEMIGIPAGQEAEDYCTVTYTTTKPNLVEISNAGVVTCKDVGSAPITITVTRGTQKKTVTVTVNIVRQILVSLTGSNNPADWNSGMGYPVGSTVDGIYFSWMDDEGHGTPIRDKRMLTCPKGAGTVTYDEEDHTWTWNVSGTGVKPGTYQITCKVGKDTYGMDVYVHAHAPIAD